MKLSQVPEGTLQKVKTVLYGIQALAVFVAWILAVAILTKAGSTGTAIKYYFALTWCCVPAFIYLAGFPLFPRTKRFINPYIIAGLDSVYTILWLASFAAVAAWTNGGIQDKSKGCNQFAYGSESKCNVSKATVVLGVIIFLLFLISSIISILSAIFYLKNGSMPNARPEISNPIFHDNQSKPSSSGDEETAETSYLNRGNDHAALPHIQTDEEIHPGRPLSWGQVPRTAPPRYEEPAHYSQSQSPQPDGSQSGGYPPPLRILPTGNPFTAESFDLPTDLTDYDNRPEMRAPQPGPASIHMGGYNSAYHTPLPLNLHGTGNSWADDQAVRQGRSAHPV